MTFHSLKLGEKSLASPGRKEGTRTRNVGSRCLVSLGLDTWNGPFPHDQSRLSQRLCGLVKWLCMWIGLRACSAIPEERLTSMFKPAAKCLMACCAPLQAC